MVLTKYSRGGFEEYKEVVLIEKAPNLESYEWNECDISNIFCQIFNLFLLFWIVLAILTMVM